MTGMAGRARSGEAAEDGAPECGLVWMRPERSPRGVAPNLSREQIVRAAIEVADNEGPRAISMRRIAAKLGVGTMSLYWYVASKDDLIDLMLDAIFGEVAPYARPSGDWRADLRLMAEESRAVLQRHSWLALFSSGRIHLGPNMLTHIEFSLAAVDGLGLDNAAMTSILGMIDDYVQGSVLRDLADREIQRRSGMGEEEWRASIAPYLRQAVASGRYPTFARFVDEDEPVDPEARFVFGLECLLDGIAVRIAERRCGV